MYFTNYFFTQGSAQKIIYLFNQCLDLYTYINTPMLKKYNYIVKKSKCHWGDILDNPLSGSMPAEKLAHVAVFCDIILYGREFSSPWGHSSCLNGPCPAPRAPMN